jgi:hypothetical protein
MRLAGDRGAIMSSPLRHPLSDRKDDCYETPPEAVWALLRVERIPRAVWEPACGPGAIVRELRRAGHIVHASDLVDYGCPDSEARVDFLMEWRAPPGVEAIVSNLPFKLGGQMVAHALDLVPLVIVLARLSFLESAERSAILDGPLARVHVFKSRLPMMHRAGWQGPKATSQVPYAWFAFERDHVGPALLDRITTDEKCAGASPQIENGPEANRGRSKQKDIALGPLLYHPERAR